MNIQKFAEAAMLAAVQLAQLAEIHPDFQVERNEVGNFSIITPAGDYYGYVDFRNGELEEFPPI